PIAGEQPIIGVDDLDGHQAVEKVPDIGADRSVGYHQPTPQSRAEANSEPLRSAPGLRTARHNGSGGNWPGSACSLVDRASRTPELLCPGKPPRAERSSAGPYPLSLAVPRRATTSRPPCAPFRLAARCGLAGVPAPMEAVHPGRWKHRPQTPTIR